MTRVPYLHSYPNCESQEHKMLTDFHCNVISLNTIVSYWFDTLYIRCSFSPSTFFLLRGKRDQSYITIIGIEFTFFVYYIILIFVRKIFVLLFMFSFVHLLNLNHQKPLLLRFHSVY